MSVFNDVHIRKMTSLYNHNLNNRLQMFRMQRIWLISQSLSLNFEFSWHLQRPPWSRRSEELYHEFGVKMKNEHLVDVTKLLHHNLHERSTWLSRVHDRLFWFVRLLRLRLAVSTEVWLASGSEIGRVTNVFRIRIRTISYYWRLDIQRGRPLDDEDENDSFGEVKQLQLLL